MVSWFRRKKPDAEPERRLSTEDLAAALPQPEADRARAEPPIPDEVIAAAMEDEPSLAASEPAPEPESSPAAAAGKLGWMQRIGKLLNTDVAELIGRNPVLDDELLDEIETALITADVGVTASTELVEKLRKRMKAREFADARALLKALRAELVALLTPVAQPLQIDAGRKPFVILTVGVNGVGKTTTIGKLARRYKDEGRSLMLAAGDTFRAAAVAQLQAWGERNGVAVVAQGQDADPASVAFDALQAAKSRGTEVNRSLPLYKRISAVEFTAEPLPRNALGKLLRK